MQWGKKIKNIYNSFMNSALQENCGILNVGQQAKRRTKSLREFTFLLTTHNLKEKEMKKINMFLVLFVALTITMPASLTFAAAKTTTENAVTLSEKVNINTSSEEALTTVPGIGPKTAQNIYAYKKQNGNFNTIDDLLNVKGIGEKSLKKMKPYLTI